MIAAALTLSLALGPVAPPAQAQEFDHSHAAWTAILEDAVEDGFVDYKGLRESPEALDAYLAQLAATTPKQHAGWTRDERFAFWINAYNAFTIQLVRDRGPVKSIRKLGGFLSTPWKIKFIPMPGFDPEQKNKPITLDEIEHELIRPVFKDARVHAAVNCASASCPPLRTEAFRAKDLDAQLDEQVRIWLGDPTRNRLQPVDGKVRISEIFKWFDEDFIEGRKGKDSERVLLWIADHVGDEALAERLRKGARTLKIRYLDYDWSINAKRDRR
jgi:hypothetical protein